MSRDYDKIEELSSSSTHLEFEKRQDIMSLISRVGGQYVLAELASFLPRLPSITLGTLNPSDSKLDSEEDSRLDELKEQIEKNNGKPPFMIDNGMILRAVPKKKPSYSRTRTKLYAPGDKKIQHLDNIVRCPACGHVKRSHFMCMNCFAEIRMFLKGRKKALMGDAGEPQADLDPIDEKIIYPGKHESDYERRIRSKDWVPVREKPLPFNAKQVRNKKD